MLRPVEPREGHLVPIVRIVCTEHSEENSSSTDRFSIPPVPVAELDDDIEFRQKMDAAHDRWLLYLD